MRKMNPDTIKKYAMCFSESTRTNSGNFIAGHKQKTKYSCFLYTKSKYVRLYFSSLKQVALSSLLQSS